MKLKHALIALAAVVGLTATAGVAFAFRKGGDDSQRAEKIKKFVDYRVNDVLDDLEADDTQRTRINATKDRLVGQAEQLFTSRGELRTALMDQWKQEKPDADAIHKLIDDRIDEMRALAHQAADAGLEVHGTLNPKQRAELAELIGSRWHH